VTTVSTVRQTRLAVDSEPLLDRAVALGLRKLSTTVEEVFADGGVDALRAVRQASAVAVVSNPWVSSPGVIASSGEGPQLEDLHAAIEGTAPILAKLLSDRLLAALGGADAIEAFGKGAVVGLGGEIEHAGALIHTPYFGNLLREFLEGTSIICFADARADAGSDLRVPMWHKNAAATRSHYQSLEVHLADAPHHDEIAVIAVASTGARPHPL